ncbi:efflux RND transporter permease subunit [Immundisolibacter sp.]|uniref:efflux RND transporter permease subunit n=1 Tax=Immundisolibacter sp. TaxID=1934948 RepID=UPI0019C250C3|nr:efflux RND transporter permease subunit [Immundisolibacter sp.]MBC7162463.1 efflux RND transporter permease subunit [Immundisolibacter sp.]MEA3219802.1 Cobalt-zinc-cadmium resistance protein CzcA [Immundisolibacter sp.]
MSRYNLAEWGLRRPALTAYLIGLILVGGAVAFFGLGQTDMPDWTLRAMPIRVFWPGASAEQIEQQVVDKIERKLQDTPYLKSLVSTSKPGEAWIWVNLENSLTDPKTKVPDIWYQVRKKVGDIRDTLPPGVQGPYFNDEFGDVYPLVYGIWGDEFSYAELKDQADWLREELLRLPIVEKVVLIGAQPQRVYLNLSTARLGNLRVSPLALTEAIAGHNAMQAAGQIENTSDRLRLRLGGQFGSVDDVRRVPVPAADGRLLTVGDLAEISAGYQDPAEQLMRVNGHPAVGLAISMAAGGNVVDLRRDVVTLMQRLEAGLTVGVHTTLVADEPQVVTHTLDKFLFKLAVAVGIVLLVSYATLGLRSGLVVATAFPLVLGATFMAMQVMGIDLQRISLGALIISLGLLVDDAIIIVEMMQVKMRQGLDRFHAASAAYTSTSLPMLTGTLVTIAGFMPIALAKSALREFMFGLYGVIAVALLVSWLVSVLFTPYLAYRMLPAQVAHHDEVYDTPFYRRLRGLVRACVNRPGWVAATVALLVGLAAVAGRQVEKQFFPLTDRPDLIVETWLPEGSSFAANETLAKDLDRLLAGEAGVVRWVSYIGSDTPRIFTDLWIELPTHNVIKTYVQTTDRPTRDRLREALRTRIAGELPQARARVNVFPFGMPAPSSIEYRITGPDRATLREFAAQVRAVMHDHPQTSGVHYSWRGPVSTVRLDLDQARLTALGLSAQRLGESLDMLLSGRPVTQLRDRDETIDVVLRLTEDERTRLGYLPNVPVPLADGSSLPLGQLAHLQPAVEEGVVSHYNRVPAIMVYADLPWYVQPLDVDAQLRDRLDAIRQRLPLGYHLEIGGIGELSAEVDEAIGAVMPIIAVAIVTLLMLQLQHLGLTLLVLASAPLGLIGVLVTLWVADLPLGLVAQLGVLALAGITMRNTVILVDQIRQDVAAGLSRHEAVIESTVRRFRPIVVTAAAAILALLPLLTDPFWGPMAYAMMGGLLVATVLTVLFVPTLYAACFRVQPSPAAPPPV